MSNISTETYHFSDKFDWDMAVHRLPFTDESRVLYYFHGSGGSVSSWEDSQSGKDMIQYWTEVGSAPLIITISYGETWVLIPDFDENKSSQLDHFWNRVVPEVNKITETPTSERYIMGYSMGGYNALQVVLSDPEFFQKLLLASPAVFSFSPFDDEDVKASFLLKYGSPSIKERIKYILQRDSSAIRYTGIIAGIQNIRSMGISNNEEWLKMSPYHNVMNQFDSNYPSLYISCGRKDPFGLHKVSRDFVKFAKSKELYVQWESLRGGHLSQDGYSAATFLEK